MKNKKWKQNLEKKIYLMTNNYQICIKKVLNKYFKIIIIKTNNTMINICFKKI